MKIYYTPNIFVYENTNYVIGCVKKFNFDIGKVEFNVVISRDENFKTISTLLTIKSESIHELTKVEKITHFANNNLVQYKDSLKLYFIKILY